MCSKLSHDNCKDDSDSGEHSYSGYIDCWTMQSTSKSHDSFCKSFEECKKRSTIDQEEYEPSIYLERRIFPLLLPAIEDTLKEASKWNALRMQKCRFNGLDYIAELLWNHNPRRSKRYKRMLNVFEIPSFKEYLILHPRPYYPKSWLWSEEEAALRIQKYVRGWLIRKRDDVQEMRQFWKNIAGIKLFGKPEQTQGKLSETQEDPNLIRCEKYRSMYRKYKTMRLKMHPNSKKFHH